MLRHSTRAATAAAAAAENAAPAPVMGMDDVKKGGVVGHQPARRGLADISHNVVNVANVAGAGANANGANAKKGALRTTTATTAASRAPTPPPTSMMEECDAAVAHDPKYVSEYAGSIFHGMLQTEQKWLVSPSYMSSQTDITPRMRAILCDWLVEVHQKFKLLPQTLYISVNILDRYLEQVITMRDELQLVGCACLWMASKFEEIYAPEPQDFVLISDKAFKRQDLQAAEGKILNVLEFRLTVPTHYTFLTRFCFVANASKRQKLLALYCLERTLQEYAFLKYKPSLIAAASLLVALESSGLAHESMGAAPRWTSALERSSGYADASLRQCMSEIRDLIRDAEHRSLLAVRKKFLLDEFEAVAKLDVSPAPAVGVAIN